MKELNYGRTISKLLLDLNSKFENVFSIEMATESSLSESE